MFTLNSTHFPYPTVFRSSHGLGCILLLPVLAACRAEILLRDGHAPLRAGLLLLEPALALALMGLDARPGTAQVLLIVWITQVVTAWTPMRAMLAVVLADIALYLVFVAPDHSAPHDRKSVVEGKSV